MKTTEPLLKSALIAALLALPLAAHADHISFGIRLGVPAPVVVAAPPPPVYQETVYAAPAPGYVLVPGHWSWRGRWVWIRGEWVMPPQPGAYWVAGAYQGQNWVEGHWEVAQAAPPGPPPPPTAGEVIVSDEAPPPPMAETVVGVAPGPDYIWIGGYWGWDHGHRLWVRGHWDRPPRHGAVWVSPRWEHREGRYVFVRGYWR
jgi:hypothetical protein